MALRAELKGHQHLFADIKMPATPSGELPFPTRHLNEVAAILKQRDARRRLTDTELIANAASVVHTSGEDAELLRLGQAIEWRLGSGAAHGRLLMTMHRTGSRHTEGNLTMFAGTYEEAAMSIAGVTLILNRAWQGWDLRRTARPT